MAYNFSMHEFEKSHYPALLPLVATLDQPVLPLAVLEGTTAGWVFTDEIRNPTLALIGLPCGYFFGAGAAPEGDTLTAARRVVSGTFVPHSQACGNFGFLFSFSGPDWIERLPLLLLGHHPFHIFRRAFTFQVERFVAAERALPTLPEGYTLRPIDADLLAEQPALRQEILGTWSSVPIFLAQGCGAAVLHGAEVASFCLAPFATHEKMEISVSTAEAFKRRGLARRAAAAFIRRCLELGKQPNWECFWDNEPSIGLARSLGYATQKDYPIFYWEEKPEPLASNDPSLA
jgi:hypothetical protein